MSQTEPEATQTFLPFQLGDPAGRLFFGHILALAHQALEQFIVTGLHLKWSEWFMNKDWIAPIRHAESDFLRPLHVGQEALIKISVSNLSTSSVTFHYEFIQNETLCAVVTTTHVFCELESQKKINIPSDVKSVLTEHSIKLDRAEALS